MQKLLSTVMLLALFTTAFSQSKLDGLTNNPYKKDGHFVGIVKSENYRNLIHPFHSFELVFDFWGLLGEPVSMYYFKWIRPSGLGGISASCYSAIAKDPRADASKFSCNLSKKSYLSRQNALWKVPFVIFQV